LAESSKILRIHLASDDQGMATVVRVLYDSSGLQEAVGGVSRYFAEMARRLPADIEPVFSAVELRATCFRAAPYGLPAARFTYADFLPRLRLPMKYRAYRLASRLFPQTVPGFEERNARAFAQRLAEGEWDLVHLTSPHAFGPELQQTLDAGVPFVLTVHDLIPELFELKGYRKDFRRQALERAAGLIAVSEHTKHDLVRQYGVPEEKVAVIAHGAMESVLPEPVETPEDYVLFVGKREGYKNHAWMMEALAPLVEQGIAVVSTGNPIYTDGQLVMLYRKARAFVYPSRYEGFGLPILDAWQNECPVILSRASCFPEIGGDAALYFDLDDADGLRRAVLDVGNADVRQELVRRGKVRVSQFTWERCARETAKVYRKASELK